MNFETWNVTKDSRRFSKAIIASQNKLASEAGKQVLEQGGNAVDAAIAAAFAIGVVEPWQSGLGGVGKMIIKMTEESSASIIEFPAKSLSSSNPDAYPLEGQGNAGMFKWPKVIGNRNIEGKYSVCIPGMVKGLGLAHSMYANRSWHELLQPAISLSEKPLYVDPISSCKLLSISPGIDKYEELKKVFFENNLPPVTSWLGEVPYIRNQNLTDTLRLLSENGPEDFYFGDVSKKILRDCADQGIEILRSDLENYEAYVFRSELIKIGADSVIYSSETPFSLRSIGKTITKVNSIKMTKKSDSEYRGSVYRALVESILYEDNKEHKNHSCTTHISCIDSSGNAVSLTITLLSLFGSKVMLPETGIIVNNGMMWFDPRPGAPNSIASSKIPPNNMYPTLMKSGNNIIAMGASGGRRILPCIAQMAIQKAIFNMSADYILSIPRLDIDVDGALVYEADADYGFDLEDVFSEYKLKKVVNTVNPNFFACPNLVEKDLKSGSCIGAAFPLSPAADVSGI